MVTVEQLQKIATSFKGVTEDIKWEDHLCFNVWGKMFLILSPDLVPVSASFKTSPEDFDALCEGNSFQPAPYLARYTWVFTKDINSLTVKEWAVYIEKSYRLIAEKLPAKLKKSLINKG